MFKSSFKVAMLAVVSAVSVNSAIAQDNILANKPIYTLGEAKTWTSEDGTQTYSFIVEDLNKLVAVPSNTANVYLYPENGAINTEESRATGIQGFYIDMEKSQEVKTIITTWEGAAANAVEIYLTDEVPTLAILKSPATFSATGLGQYQEKTFILPDGVKGRYLVFQPTDATNWGWGVKMRSIAASAPAESVLTQFSVSPSFVTKGSNAAVTYTIKNQFGLDMTADITVEGGSLDGDVLTIDGDYATFTATAGGVEMQSVVYAVSAPAIPTASAILAPVYTNYPEGYTFNDIDFNGLAGFIEAYNGGAKILGRLRWENGEVAAAFGDTRCVFFYNQSPLVMGGWDADINPTEKGYGTLHLDIYATRNLTGNVVFERTVTIGDNYEITLQAGRWNSIDVPLLGETVLHTMSVRFNEENAGDIILSNIYFAAQVADGDEEAPVFGDVTVEALPMGATLTMSATDNSSTRVYYGIQVGENHYSCNGKSGEEVTYTIPGLTPETDYTASITVSDGVNVSEPKEVTFRTAALPAPPEPTLPSSQVLAVFSKHYGVTALPSFDNWGSAAYAEPLTIGDKTVLSLNNYQGQWGGLVNFGVNAAEIGAKSLHIDILGSSVDGELTIYPVWNNEEGISVQAEGTHLVTPIKANEWNSLDFDLQERFGYTAGNIFQLALNGSTIPNFAVDNFYFYSDGELTAVSDVILEDAVNSDIVYDVQGRVVAKGINACQNLPAGIYVIKGKKFIKK